MKPFQILSPIFISISHENPIETLLRSNKFRLAKGRCVKPGASFQERNKFF